MGNQTSAVKRLILILLAVAVVAVIVGVVAGLRGKSSTPAWTKPVPYDAARPSHPAGGDVRLVVATPPEIDDTGSGGTTLRSLVLPRLFDAEPNKTWSPSLVQPGSDGASRDGLTAWFTLRKANWSDGTPITADDLRRTKDDRFVTSVDGPDAKGRITVHLRSKLPNWRMLWSGDSGIAAPKPNVYAGPFTVTSIISGDATVVSRNAGWFDPPLLDAVELDYVPDPTTARQLLQAGDVDVVGPVADTQRTPLYKALPEIDVETSDQGGRWTALKFNSTSSNSTYVGVLSVFPRSQFVNSLLQGEAASIDGFAERDKTWTNYGSASSVNLSDADLTFTVPAEEPLGNLVAVSLERGVTGAGGKFQIRSTDTATLNEYVSAGTFDLAFVTYQSQPQFCWTCVFGDVDTDLARKADAGDNSAALKLEQQARDDGILLPLWRDNTVVAYRPQVVGGVEVNGYSGSPAWNAADWWKP